MTKSERRKRLHSDKAHRDDMVRELVRIYPRRNHDPEAYASVLEGLEELSVAILEAEGDLYGCVG